MNLTILQLRLTFEVTKEVNLPQYNSPTWRGWLGHALLDTPIYAAFFEGTRPQDSERFKTSAQIPQPYVVVNTPNQSGKIAKGQTLTLHLNVFGEAWRVLPVLVPALDDACQFLPLGKGQGGIKLMDIDYQWINELQKGWQELPNLEIQPPVNALEIPPCPDEVNLQFITPLRLVKDKKLIKPNDFNWPFMMRLLLYRINNLSYFHQNIQPGIDIKKMKQSYESICENHQLRLLPNKRYSNHQEKFIFLDGLLGNIHLSFKPSQTELWPMIWLGQFTHAGKACVMGMGQYRLLSKTQ